MNSLKDEDSQVDSSLIVVKLKSTLALLTIVTQVVWFCTRHGHPFVRSMLAVSSDSLDFRLIVSCDNLYECSLLDIPTSFMASLQLVNAILNVLLWALGGISGRVIESIYVSAAKLQLKFRGRTRATDSSEIDIFQWLPGRTGIFGHTHGLEIPQTAKWVFSLLLFSVLFLPAELYAETGIDERKDCSPSDVSQNGLCSSPWQGHSDVGIASSALLVQKFTWVDQNWDIVYEGVSPNMIAEEVHVEARGKQGEGETPRRVLASECHVSVSPFTQRGTLTVGSDNGAFATIITKASIASADLANIDEEDVQRRCPFATDSLRPVSLSHGDLTYDFETGLAFFFWALPCEEVTSDSNIPMFKLKAKGVEALLSDDEIGRVLLGRTEPWDLSLSSNRTRLYDITCKSNGLGWKDLMKAVSLYRTMQMEQPGLQRTNVEGDLARVPPLSSSDVLKALFALKAEDVRSDSCSRSVPQYQQCGTYIWSRAWAFVGLCSVALALWFAFRLYVGKHCEIAIPHTTASWRYVAALGEAKGEIGIVVDRDNGICVRLPGIEDD